MWEDNQLTLRPATDYEGTIHANSGIAMIVPVEELKALLYRSDLQHLRDNAVASYNKARPSVVCRSSAFSFSAPMRGVD
jgi:hypothetical protein